MTQQGPGECIPGNPGPTLQAWEDLACATALPALTTEDGALRHHARQLLQAFAADLSTRRADEEAAAKAKGLDERGAAVQAARQGKILVVDDERDLADLACALLDAYGFEAIAAYSAQEALEMLERDGAIDVLFSDVMMPRMTGLELADVVRARHPHVAIVLTSGYTAPDLLAGHERGYRYLAKPYRAVELVWMVDRG
jgi:CheY-like chemotaxis protein